MTNKTVKVKMWDDDINRSVVETASVILSNKNIESNKYEVQLKMSKEAMIGFGTEAIATACTTEDDEYVEFHVDALANPCGNQALGFFLTSSSPGMVIMYNKKSSQEVSLNNNFKKIDYKSKSRCYYEVPLYEDDQCYNPYEIGFRNIIQMVVNDENGVDVSDQIIDVIFYINRKGLFDFGNNLLRLAHNYEDKKEYLVAHMNGNEEMYDLGIVLSEESCQLRISIQDNKCVYDYEPDFGII